MKRLGFGAVPTAAPASSKAAVEEDNTTAARDRFSGQKAISSDQYFNRGHYDPDASAEAQRRLQDFRGATGISSNQYFGREEEEERAMITGGGDGGLAQLEVAARDAMERVMSNPDVQRVGEIALQKARQVRSKFPLLLLD